MKVISEGEKPQPWWFGRWACKSCGRTVELETEDDQRHLNELQAPAPIIFPYGRVWIACPTCEGERREYERVWPSEAMDAEQEAPAASEGDLVDIACDVLGWNPDGPYGMVARELARAMHDAMTGTHEAEAHRQQEECSV